MLASWRGWCRRAAATIRIVAVVAVSRRSDRAPTRSAQRRRSAPTTALTAIALMLLAPATAAANEPPPTERVVNGAEVSEAEFAASWSFAVYIRAADTACGGSLVTETVVVTAAHCLVRDGVRVATESIAVHGGAANLQATLATSVVGVADTMIHPGFDSAVAGSVNDIALLRLAAPVSWGRVNLAAAAETPSGTARVAGWGCHAYDPATGDCAASGVDLVLRAASVPIVAQGSCPYVIDPAVHLCAGSFSPTLQAPDACYGDSGGPLTIASAGGPRLVGITSAGSECGRFPGLYTSVAAMRSFIDGQVAAWDPGALASGARGTLEPIVPRRVLDTRGAQPLSAGRELRVDVSRYAPGPPSALSAASLNVTAVDPAASGYLTVYPCGTSAPVASNVNFEVGMNAAGAAFVGLSDGATVCVTSSAATHLIVDVGGYFMSDHASVAGATYHPIAPTRRVDTRTAAELTPDVPFAIDVSGLSASPISAVTLNVAAIDPATAGYLSVFPCGAGVPSVSNVNYSARANTANAVTVAVSPDERVCVASSSATDLVVDATGWFGQNGQIAGQRFIPVAPSRLADTRNAGPLPANRTLVVPAAGRNAVPATATAVVATVTAVGSEDTGYLSTYGCTSDRPTTSTVNFTAHRDVPNLATVGVLADGNICVLGDQPTHVLVDVAGYFAP